MLRLRSASSRLFIHVSTKACVAVAVAVAATVAVCAVVVICFAKPRKMSSAQCKARHCKIRYVLTKDTMPHLSYLVRNTDTVSARLIYLVSCATMMRGKRKACGSPPPPSPTPDTEFTEQGAQDVWAICEAEVDAGLKLPAQREEVTSADDVTSNGDVQTAMTILASLAEKSDKTLASKAMDVDAFLKTTDDAWLASGTELPVSVIAQALSMADMRSARIGVVLDKIVRILQKTRCRTMRVSVHLE